jgi:hypothetical protein
MANQVTEDAAVRVATLLSTVMNVVGVLDNAPVLQATDQGELRSTLLWIADEMGWTETIAGSLGGLSLPLDARDRIECLRSAAGGWDPLTPPPSALLDAARECLGMLQPSTRTQP